MPTVLDYLQIPPDHQSQGASLLPLIKGDMAGFKGAEFAFIDRLPWWEYVLGGWHLEHQSERDAQYTAQELVRMKEYQSLLRNTINSGEYPPGCIAIRTNDWKLILHERRELLENISWWNFISGRKFPVTAVELYDLKADPLEQNNVAAEHPQVVEMLRTRLLEWDTINNRNRIRTGDGKPLIIPYP
jgi:hypothetical protein